MHQSPDSTPRCSPQLILAWSTPFGISSGRARIEGISLFFGIHHPLLGVFNFHSKTHQSEGSGRRLSPRKASGARRGDRSFHSSDLIMKNWQKNGGENQQKWKNIKLVGPTKNKEFEPVLVIPMVLACFHGMGSQHQTNPWIFWSQLSGETARLSSSPLEKSGPGP